MSIIDERFINKYGLINSAIHDSPDIVEENSPLYTKEFINLAYMLGKTEEVERFELALHKFYEKCYLGLLGLYDQHPTRHHNHDDYMSPDQLIAMVAFFYSQGGGDDPRLQAIWSWLKKHWFTYDNISQETNFDRIMQPSAIFFIGVLAGAWWLSPLLSITLIWSAIAKEDETSGRIKAFVMLDTFFNPYKFALPKITWNYCAKKYFKHWVKIFWIYFPDIHHPIRRLLAFHSLVDGNLFNF